MKGTVYTFGIIAATSISVTLSVTGFGLIVITFSIGVACASFLMDKVLYELLKNKLEKNEKYKERAQQIKNSFDILFIKFWQDNIIDKTRSWVFL